MATTPDLNLSKRLGSRLAQLRTERGLSQEQVAHALEVHVETISRIERGTSLPSLSRLYELAEALGVPVTELLLGSSVRTSDIAAECALLLGRLSQEDQAFVRLWFAELCEHLRTTRPTRKKAT